MSCVKRSAFKFNTSSVLLSKMPFGGKCGLELNSHSYISFQIASPFRVSFHCFSNSADEFRYMSGWLKFAHCNSTHIGFPPSQIVRYPLFHYC